MDKTSYDFLDVLRGTIEDKVSTLDQTIYCKIVGINEDYTLDVTVIPDETTRIKSVVNTSKYEFNVGDYGILYKIGNNLANAFIIAKLGPSYEDNQPLSKQVVGGGNEGGSGGTVVNNYYQTISLPSVIQKFTTTITGDGTTTDFSITHGLGTGDVQVSVYLTGQTIGRKTGNELVMVDTYVEDGITHLVHLVFAIAPTASQTFKVVVIG